MPIPPYHCPVCRTALPAGTDPIVCAHCGESYAVHAGLPELVAKRYLDAFKAQEQHFHDELSGSVSGRGVTGRESSFHRHFKAPLRALGPAATILEVACGTRTDGIELAQEGQSVTACDLSPEAVEHSRTLAQRSGVGDRIRFCVADAEHLPFADGAFDATFVAASFHHFPNQEATLTELARVTRPGGYVVLGVEPAAWPYRMVYPALAPVKRFIRQRRARRFDSIADDSTTGYTESGLRQLLSAAGLEMVEVRRVKLLSELYDSSVRLLGRLLRRPLESSRPVDHALAAIDDRLCRVPGLRQLAWHWNVIARTKDQEGI